MQFSGVVKSLSTRADVSYGSSCSALGRRLVISSDLNALSFVSCFSSTSARFFSILLLLLAIWQCSTPPPDLFSASFHFLRLQAPESFELQHAETPACWYLGVLKSNWLHGPNILRSWGFSFWNTEILLLVCLFHFPFNLNWLNFWSVWSKVIFYDQCFHNVITACKNSVAFVTLSFDLSSISINALGLRIRDEIHESILCCGPL